MTTPTMFNNPALRDQAIRTGAQFLVNRTPRDLPTLEAFNTLVTRTRAFVDQILPASNQFTVQQPTKVQRQLGGTWRSTVVPLLDDFENHFAFLAGALRTTLTDTTHNADYIRTQKQTSVEQATTAVGDLGQQVDTAITELLAKAERLALPLRPEPVDALQEARLAGIKSDLQMLTNRLNLSSAEDRDAFVDRLASRLTAALADKDTLAAWLICSNWVVDVLATSLAWQYDEDLSMVRYIWQVRIADILAAGSPDAASAIATYQSLSDTQRGLPALLVATGGFTTSVVNDIRDYTLSQRR